MPAGTKNRINDRETDHAGCFIIGTLSLDQREGKERLVRIEDKGRLAVVGYRALQRDCLAGGRNTAAWRQRVDSFPRVVAVGSPTTVWPRSLPTQAFVSAF